MFKKKSIQEEPILPLCIGRLSTHDPTILWGRDRTEIERILKRRQALP